MIGLLGATQLSAGCAGQPTPKPAAPAQRSAAPTTAAEPAAPKLPDADRVVERFDDATRRAKLMASLQGLDAWVAEYGRAQRLAGLFVGVVIDGELAKSSAYGLRDREAGAAVTADTVFRVGSITKTITASALLSLRDAGKVVLDAPASRYLQPFATVRAPTRDSPAITLRHLLSHTSGLRRDGRFDSDMKKTDVSEQEMLDTLRHMPLEFVPGTRYQYSNFGFGLLGLIVARASGRSYREYLKAALFDPLGMPSAAWEPAAVDPAQLAIGYASKGKRFVRERSYLHTGAAEAGGGLYLSGRDFGRYLGWQLDAHPARDDVDDGPVRRASIRESHAPGRLIKLAVAKAGDASEWHATGRAGFIGLSWHGYRDCRFDRVVQHNGRIDRFASDSLLLPDHGVAVFAFANTAPTDLGRLTRRIVDRMQAGGGLVTRVRKAERAPALERALGWLLEVQNEWNETKYLTMLSDAHKRAVTTAEEKRELAHYFALHGRCTPGTMVSYRGPTAARFRLACERGQLEMNLELESRGYTIAGFWGHSSDVPAAAGAREAAERVLGLLAEWSDERAEQTMAPAFLTPKFERFAKRHATAHGRCSLGTLKDRDAADVQRFAIDCPKSGKALWLSLKLTKDGRVGSLWLKPNASGNASACPRKASREAAAPQATPPAPSGND
jgi:CubicO group peptidase (beta-lactamase class C family)